MINMVVYNKDYINNGLIKVGKKWIKDKDYVKVKAKRYTIK